MKYEAYGALKRDAERRAAEWKLTGEAKARAEYEAMVTCWLEHPLDCRCSR